MPRYEACDESVRSIVAQMLERYHQPLRDADVRIDVLKAFALTDENGDQVGCAIKHQGYQAAGVVRILNLKDRTKGLGDAEIIIDGDRWDTWSEDEKAALIDHELEHLELRYDKDGLLIRDDLNRPKLRIRKHDHQFGWFDSVARRHGQASFEVQQWEEFKEANKQLWLPFAEGEEIPQSGGLMRDPAEEPAESEHAEDLDQAGVVAGSTVSREEIMGAPVERAPKQKSAARHTRSAAATR